MRITLMTYWRDKEIVCCCPVKNQCRKNHNCEELVFTLDPFDGVENCMKERSYKRVKGGALRQK